MFCIGRKCITPVGCKHAQNAFQRFAFRVDIQFDGLGQIQAEDAHDGFCIDDIPAGYQIKSKSNLEISLTKDLTLSMELSEICTVFIATILPDLPVYRLNTYKTILPAEGEKVKLSFRSERPKTLARKGFML